MARTLLITATAIAALFTSTVASAAPPRLPGIDVSRFQDRIDWPAVAADGIRFAFVQASRGSGADCSVVASRCGTDGRYDANYTAAKAAGVRVGPYHRAFVGGDGPRAVKADARAEARLFTDSVGRLAGSDLRPALDMETPFAGLSPVELRIWTRTWLDSVRRRLRVKPIIYTNATSWGALGDPAWFARHGYPLWVANWNVGRPQVPADNWGGRAWRVWQHSSEGRVDGIAGHVDLDLLRGGFGGLTVAR